MEDKVEHPGGLSSDDGAACGSTLRASIPDAIGVTGTQLGCQKPDQYRALRQTLGELRNAYRWMNNGDCVGFDNQAGLLWQWMDGLIHLRPPTKRGRRAFLVADKGDAPAPYLDRNRVIAERSAILVAGPQEMFEQQRSGTWMTIRHARKLKRPIIIVWPDGSRTFENGAAQAMDTRRAETEGLRAKPDSAVGETDVPKDPDLPSSVRQGESR